MFKKTGGLVGRRFSLIGDLTLFYSYFFFSDFSPKRLSYSIG